MAPRQLTREQLLQRLEEIAASRAYEDGGDRPLTRADLIAAEESAEAEFREHPLRHPRRLLRNVRNVFRDVGDVDMRRVVLEEPANVMSQAAADFRSRPIDATLRYSGAGSAAQALGRTIRGGGIVPLNVMLSDEQLTIPYIERDVGEQGYSFRSPDTPEAALADSLVFLPLGGGLADDAGRAVRGGVRRAPVNAMRPDWAEPRPSSAPLDLEPVSRPTSPLPTSRSSAPMDLNSTFRNVRDARAGEPTFMDDLTGRSVARARADSATRSLNRIADRIDPPLPRKGSKRPALIDDARYPPETIRPATATAHRARWTQGADGRLQRNYTRPTDAEVAEYNAARRGHDVREANRLREVTRARDNARQTGNVRAERQAEAAVEREIASLATRPDRGLRHIGMVHSRSGRGSLSQRNANRAAAEERAAVGRRMGRRAASVAGGVAVPGTLAAAAVTFGRQPKEERIPAQPVDVTIVDTFEEPTEDATPTRPLPDNAGARPRGRDVFSSERGTRTVSRPGARVAPSEKLFAPFEIDTRSSEQIEIAQREINEAFELMGLPKIAEDGIIGDETRGAMAALANRYGLQPTDISDAFRQALAYYRGPVTIADIQLVLARAAGMQGRGNPLAWSGSQSGVDGQLGRRTRTELAAFLGVSPDDPRISRLATDQDARDELFWSLMMGNTDWRTQRDAMADAAASPAPRAASGTPRR
jgi:hypothetical protein